MPALATSRSTPPARSTKASIACLTDALSVTSHGRTCAVPPRRPTSSDSASSSSADRAASPTVAPRAARRSASARPMPREAPVTNALVPAAISTPRPYRPWITMASMASAPATEAEEEYLQTLFWLHEAGLPMTGANVARAMQLSPPTVHEMIGRLEKDGYIERAGDKTISFTGTGQEHAEGIVRRHRLIERFLTDVLGIPWDEVHEEAERLEHAMSPVLEARMLAAIGDAKTCPHGHPLVAGSRIQGVPLADVEAGATIKVLRFENEAEELLHYLKKSGLEPGLEGTVAERRDGEVLVRAGDRTLEIDATVAETVSVVADPSPPPRVALPEQLVISRDRYGR